MPRASVIIPAHNAAMFIEKAVRSALGQSLEDLEILVVNDSSTDNTEEVVRKIASADTRIRLLRNPGRRGPSAARNVGLSACSGEWVTLLDADDAMKPDRIRTLILEATSRQLDVLADNLEVRDFESGIIIENAFPDDMMSLQSPITMEWLLENDMPGLAHRAFGFCKPILSLKSLRTSAALYDENISMAEDYLFYASLLLSGLRFGVSKTIGYEYYLRKDSITSGVKTSQQMVAVNRQIYAAWRSSHSKGDSSDLGPLFAKRTAAFRYEDLAYAIKRRNILATLAASVHISPVFTFQKVFPAIRRRFTR